VTGIPKNAVSLSFDLTGAGKTDGA
jgi:hypothetical protein